MHDSKHFSSASGEMAGWRPTGVILINSTDCKKLIKQENAYHTQHIWLTATQDMSVCVCVYDTGQQSGPDFEDITNKTVKIEPLC